MIYYKELDIDNLQFEYINVSRKGRYCNDIFTFDIETTSSFVLNGNAYKFDYSKSATYYKPYTKYGSMYIWMFGINKTVVYGRTLEEFAEFIDNLSFKITDKWICYVHNLAFELQFMFNIIKDFSVFARKAHRPIKAESSEYNVEFRCSYILTQLSLANCVKGYNLTVAKKVGDLDYDVPRNSMTELTPQELGYCEGDIIVLYELISHFKRKYRSVQNIPLTQTGEVRREIQRIYKRDTQYRKYILNCQPRTLEEMELLIKAFWGGISHGNAIHQGNIVDGVSSKDFASDYPAKMVCKKYPSTFFFQINTDKVDKYKNDYALIYKCRLYGVNSRFLNNYLSVSKCQKVRGVVEDNGRLDKADYIELVCTSVDFDMIVTCYDIECVFYEKILASKYEYLDTKYIDYVLTLFNDKTALKNTEGQESLYAQSKQYINSMYGMMVTCPLNDNVNYDGGWIINSLTEEDKKEKIESLRKSRRTFLSYSHGVWVTAWAREELFRTVIKIDRDVVYMDTDSIKHIGNHSIIFKKHNLKILAELINACAITVVDLDKATPYDKHGERHCLGLWDNDGYYDKFVFLGAKKYAYETEGDIHITVAGVSKKGALALRSLEDFTEGFIFEYDFSGKKTLFYNDTQEPYILTDEQGHTEVIECEHGICLMPTTYELSSSATYQDYLSALEFIQHE